MVKHTQTIRRQEPTNCLSVFDHFVGLALQGLKWFNNFIKLYWYSISSSWKMKGEGKGGGSGEGFQIDPQKKLPSKNPILLGLREGFIGCWQKQHLGIIYMTGINSTWRSHSGRCLSIPFMPFTSAYRCFIKLFVSLIFYSPSSFLIAWRSSCSEISWKFEQIGR